LQISTLGKLEIQKQALSNEKLILVQRANPK